MKRRPKPPSRSPGIVDSVRLACRRENRLATSLGGLLGAAVPGVTYVLAHHEVDVLSLTWEPRLALVLGGLMFSMMTVIQWGRLALGSWPKAVGFAVLLEGTMVLSSHTWLALTALVYLAFINAVATGVTLARGAKEISNE